MPTLPQQRRHTDEYDYLEPLFDQLHDSQSSKAQRRRIREELVTGHLPLANHLARKFAHRGQPDTVDVFRRARPPVRRAGISCAIHGSQATGSRVAVHVSPSSTPRRSPTSAVAAGTAAAAHTTEPRRR